MEDIEFSRRLKRLGRVACLPAPVAGSTRKWRREGVWRTIGLMWLLRCLYALGASPESLHRLYYGRDPAQRPPSTVACPPAATRTRPAAIAPGGAGPGPHHAPPRRRSLGARRAARRATTVRLRARTSTPSRVSVPSVHSTAWPEEPPR